MCGQLYASVVLPLSSRLGGLEERQISWPWFLSHYTDWAIQAHFLSCPYDGTLLEKLILAETFKECSWFCTTQHLIIVAYFKIFHLRRDLPSCLCPTHLSPPFMLNVPPTSSYYSDVTFAHYCLSIACLLFSGLQGMHWRCKMWLYWNQGTPWGSGGLRAEREWGTAWRYWTRGTSWDKRREGCCRRVWRSWRERLPGEYQKIL